MRSDSFAFTADDGATLFVYRFLPDEGGAPRGIVHVAHGMAEHAGRYARLAGALTAAGWVVYANDHRGHGRTAAGDADLGFVASSGGFARVVRDLELLVEHEKREHPGLPVTLFGHSMGSFFVQELLIEHSGELKAAVLSGSNGRPNLLATLGRLVARIERWRLGERGRSALLRTLSFDAFNKQFSPNRTKFDWLSRDDAEVDKYVADPRCGFNVTTSMWVDVLDGTAWIARPEREARIKRDLPVLIFSGARDPVGENTRGVQRLIDAYAAAGLERVTHRFYPDGRHESLNEINRDAVTRDLIAWLDAVHAS